MRLETVKRLTSIILAMVLGLGCVSCSSRKLMVREFVRMVDNGSPAIEQEDDLLLLAQAMPPNIKLMETLLVNDPNNPDLLLILSKLYGGYAFAILESELEAHKYNRPSVTGVCIPPDQLDDAVARYFKAGAEYALRSLECRYPDADRQLKRLKSAQVFMASLDKKDVPALFWYAFNLGGFIQHRLDSVEAMAKAHLVEKAAKRAVDLDPAYYYGNSHLALLVYYASRSPMMGGNPDKARKHFQRHIEMDVGANALREVYWARYVLVQRQEKKAFIKRLSAVVKAYEKDEPSTLLDRVAAVRAKIYLESADHFFY